MATSPMPGADGVWLGMGSGGDPMVVTAVLWLDGRLDRTLLADRLQTRLVDAYPTFRRRAVASRRRCGRRVWADDPTFDLDHHLRTAELGGDRDEAALAELVGELTGTPLDMSRSPWQVHLVAGPGAGSTLVARLHHCIGDGVALASVLLTLTDDATAVEPGAGPKGRGREPEAGPQRRGREQGAVRRVVSAARGGADLVATGLGILLAPRAAGHPGSSGPAARRTVAWTRPIGLHTVTGVGRRLDATVNDVLLAVVAGALRSQRLGGGAGRDDLRVFLPVSLRPPGQSVPAGLGNRFGIVFVVLPVSVADPVQRVAAVRAHTRRSKAGAQASATFAALSALGALPAWVQRFAVRLLGATSGAVVTNVVGPRAPVCLAGVGLHRMVFWVPQPGGTGLGLSILSYAGSVTVGVAADRDADGAVDPARLARAVEAELDGIVARLALESRA